MGRKKIIITIVVVVVVIVAIGVYYVAKGGFTKKQRYENCAKTCEEIMFNESNIPACKQECESITGYSPTAGTTKTTNTNTQKTTNSAKNYNANANVDVVNTSSSNANSTSVIDASAEFYCEWSWPQKIIYKNTKEVVKGCTYDRPWCYYADFSYENVSCCSDAEHTDCITLPDL
jgi:hypothetical protein